MAYKKVYDLIKSCFFSCFFFFFNVCMNMSPGFLQHIHLVAVLFGHILLLYVIHTFMWPKFVNQGINLGPSLNREENISAE